MDNVRLLKPYKGCTIEKYWDIDAHGNMVNVEYGVFNEDLDLIDIFKALKDAKKVIDSYARR